jgi:DNA primase
MSCDLFCSGDKWFALAEKVSLYEAVRRLRGMLDRGELRGRRRCFETQSAILEDIAVLAHANLLKHSAEFQRMELLKELTEETIRRFHIGVVPGSMASSIIRQMEGKGWSPQELASANLFELRLVAKKPQASVITLPIRNEHGRVLALAGAYVGRSHFRERSYNPTENYSFHRYSRLVFQYLDRGSKIQEEDRLFLMDDPLDAILVGQQGMAPVVAPVGEWDAHNLRRICSLKTRFVYAASVDVLRSEDFMSLLSLLGSDATRLDIAVLPKDMTVPRYLRAYGAQALRDRLDAAVPVGQILKV